ncbi:unnamed protein product [Effrenium voratum]|uniref:cysteine-S-conjugate beta-lyase n=1 Tax=Effrenium voratum TaxID=2562239 RepID=A0AA36IU97_9DINO|nr:unnamed protein product [Effrenium voratum]
MADRENFRWPAVGLALAGGAASFAWWWRRRRDPFGFDRALDRSGTNAVKYDLAPLIHGAKAKDGIQLWVADMDFPCCERIRKALAKRVRHPSFGYTCQPSEIWQRIGRWLVERHGWPKAPAPDCFIYSSTVVTSVSSILYSLTQPGDKVLTMVPLYPPLQGIVKAAKRSLVHHKLRWEKGRYEMDMEVLKAQLDGVKVLILCSPHNPGGRVWTPEELAALAKLCAELEVLVVVDEIWADWCFKAFTSFGPAAQRAKCRSITVGSCSKTWNLAGLHCSYIIIQDEELRKRYMDYAEPQFLHFGNIMGTEALRVCYDQGLEWLLAAKSYVLANFRVLEDFLRQLPEIQLAQYEASYLAWLDCSGLRFSSGKELHGFMLEARDKGPKVVASHPFSVSLRLRRMAMTSPTLRLFNTLLVTMLAILVGLVCVRLQLLRPGEGDLKGMGFFVGSIAFPLLIFSTVATADMGQMDFGVIGACSLGKIAVMVLTWVLAFVAFQPKRSRGQRILTASVFAFFAVASNDFALGFPVIDALYGEKQNMSVYIAGNSLVGSFVFVPLTMIAFAIGGALKSSTGDAEAASCLNIFKTVMYDLATNPVIVMTCAGLLFKGVLGQTLSHEGGKLKLPMPLSNLVDLFTAPFGMCALFLTGTSLRSPKIAVWAVGLVLMKVVVCAYLSYAFGTLLLGPATTEKEKILRDFTFFYGAIPTSSAPIVFANQFDPEAPDA